MKIGLLARVGHILRQVDMTNFFVVVDLLISLNLDSPRSGGAGFLANLADAALNTALRLMSLRQRTRRRSHSSGLIISIWLLFFLVLQRTPASYMHNRSYIPRCIRRFQKSGWGMAGGKAQNPCITIRYNDIWVLLGSWTS